jgi:hypothetical protein
VRVTAGLLRFAAFCGFAVGLVVTLTAEPESTRAQNNVHAAFDKILDTYVRDGYVYYQALQKERAPLDRYVASLGSASVDAWSREDQEAFWVNAYDALILQTVIGAYPIKARSQDFPAKSIRQIPGAFEQLKHQVGGRSLTLDQIEKDVIAQFGDARLILALGRGAIGSGRLRSEAFLGAMLERQLTAVVKECAGRASCVRIDPSQGTVEVTPLVSWREAQFVQSFASAGPMWADRSPVERAVAAMVYPHVFAREREFLALDTFRMTFGPFDWRLNDLTGGLPD